MDQLYLAALANQWFWVGLTTGFGCGVIFSALIRWVTESRD